MKSFWLQPLTVMIIFFIVINALNIQSVLINRMNVWKIFRYGFTHLANHKNLYSLYPDQYFDEYLYSPTFTVMFAPFSKLPYYFSYFLWNNISMLVAPLIIYKLPGISRENKSIICYIALLEMATCLQGTQTNAMVAAGVR